MPSKVFGPTDMVADTLTQVGSTYQMPSYPSTIYQIRFASANVVNAAGGGGHLHIETSERTYDFAVQNGAGGATNSNNIPAEIINCNIYAPANQNVKVYALMGTANKDTTVSIQFKTGGGPNNYRTLAAGGVSANGDTAADTEEAFTVSAKLTGASLQPATNGLIRRIRYAGSGVVDAKANTAKITINVPGIAGPWEFALGGGAGGAATSSTSAADVIELADGIPVSAAGTITVNITSAEIIKSPVISLEYS